MILGLSLKARMGLPKVHSNYTKNHICRAEFCVPASAGAVGCFGAMRRDDEKDGSDPISTRRHFAERLDGTGKM